MPETKQSTIDDNTIQLYSMHFMKHSIVVLGKNVDSSMHCHLFVLDSISIQNFFEIDYFYIKK